jgi:hypothetical protein
MPMTHIPRHIPTSRRREPPASGLLWSWKQPLRGGNAVTGFSRACVASIITGDDFRRGARVADWAGLEKVYLKNPFVGEVSVTTKKTRFLRSFLSSCSLPRNVPKCALPEVHTTAQIGDSHAAFKGQLARHQPTAVALSALIPKSAFLFTAPADNTASQQSHVSFVALALSPQGLAKLLLLLRTDAHQHGRFALGESQRSPWS